MATIYRCDRCALETSNRSDIRSVSIPLLNYYDNDFAGNDAIYSKDLCVKCVANIKTVMQPLPKEDKIGG